MALQNQTAIITGAGKGIGRSTAIALAKEGVHLGLIARSQADLERVQAELTGTHGVKVHFATADVADRAQVEAAVTSLIGHLGTVDILINNAGIGGFAPLLSMEPADWERIIQVNLLGTYYVTRAVLPTMLEQKRGAIINVSSTAGERGAATTTAYSASKFGLMGFTESLMQEVRKSNIRVTALTPSTVNTELAAKTGLKIGDEDRMLQPEDVAELIVDILRLPPRVFIKTAGIWTTNPQ